MPGSRVIDKVMDRFVEQNTLSRRHSRRHSGTDDLFNNTNMVEPSGNTHLRLSASV